MKETEVLRVSELIEPEIHAEKILKGYFYQTINNFINRIPLSIKYEGVTQEELRVGIKPAYWALAYNKMDSDPFTVSLTLILKFNEEEETLPCESLHWLKQVVDSEFSNFYLGDRDIGETMKAELLLVDSKIILAEDNAHIEAIETYIELR